MERVLLSFEAISEWQDLIGFLSRLAKLVASHTPPQFNSIPHSHLISKRLAQCLNPALPTGVHQKALEVYAIIFSNTVAANSMESNAVLLTWSSGLFPFTSHAAMSVKPTLLALYSQYYLPLGASLRPCLKALILAVLPMLEEDGNEFFDQAAQLLDSISRNVQHSHFFHAMWLCTISAPRHRLPAINYLVRRLAKMNGPEDMAFVIGSHSDVVAKSLAEMLEDKLVLVQRGVLELLVNYFPLNSSLFREQDVLLIVQSAVTVVLRRDMSLNRRLYAWILATDSKSDPRIVDVDAKPAEMQVKLNLEILANALRFLFSALSPSLTIHDYSKPYKIIISLMDKPEIGPVIMDALFLDIIVSLNQKIDSSIFKELLPTAVMMMDTLDAFFVWKQMHSLVSNSHIDNKDAVQIVLFILDNFRFSDDETVRVHLPFLYFKLAGQIDSVLRTIPDKTDSLFLESIYTYISVCGKLVSMVPKEVYMNSWQLSDFKGASNEERESGPNSASATHHQQTGIRHTSSISAHETTDLFSTEQLRAIERVYDLSGEENVNRRWLDCVSCGKPVMDIALYHIGRLMLQFQSQWTGLIGSNASRLKPTFAKSTQLKRLKSIIYHLGDIVAHHVEAKSTFVYFKSDWLAELSEFAFVESQDVELLHSTLKCLFHIMIDGKIPIRLTQDQIITLSKRATMQLWNYLSFEYVQYHTNIVFLIRQLMRIVGAHLVETNIVHLMLSPTLIPDRVDSFYKFGIIWRVCEDEHVATCHVFRKPLFLILDALRSDHFDFRTSGANWLRSFVKSYSRVIVPLVLILTDADVVFEVTERYFSVEKPIKVVQISERFNEAQVLYAFQTLNDLVTFANQFFIKSIWNSSVAYDEMFLLHVTRFCSWTDDSFNVASLCVAEAIILVCLRYIQSKTKEYADADQTFSQIQQSACMLIQAITSRTSTINPILCKLIHQIVLDNLHFCVLDHRLDPQPHLIILLNSISSHIHKTTSFETLYSISNIDEVPTSLSSSATAASIQTPLFVRLMKNAISFKSNRRLLQTWFDLLFSYLPQMRNCFKSVISPLLTTMCSEVQVFLRTLESIHLPDSPASLMTPTTPRNSLMIAIDSASRNTTLDSDTLLILYGIEKLVSFWLKDGPSISGVSTDGLDLASRHDAYTTGSRGSVSDTKLGSVNSVADIFQIDPLTSLAMNVTSPAIHPQSFRNSHLPLILDMIPSIIALLFDLCEASETLDAQSSVMCCNGMQSVRDRIKFRVKRILDVLFGSNPVWTLECFVTTWLVERSRPAGASLNSKPERTFSMIRLISNCDGKMVFSHLLDGLKVRLPSSSLYHHLHGNHHRDASNKNVVSVTHGSSMVADVSIIQFLEHYAQTQDDKNIKSDDLYLFALGYMKEACQHSANIKYIFPCLLRLYLTVIKDISVIQDKRVQRDAEETLQRLCDYCILIGGRVFDQGGWRRVGEGHDSLFRTEEQQPANEKHTLKDSLTGTLSISTVITPVETNEPSLLYHSLKMSVHNIRATLQHSQQAQTEDQVVVDLLNFFADSVIKQLKKLFNDQDKVMNVLNNFVYYIASPMLKQRATMKTIFYNPVLDCVWSLFQIPNGFKAFRKEVWEAFLEPKFFHFSNPASSNDTTSSQFERWKAIIHNCATTEKERVVDLLLRISATSSTTLFVSRDQEFVTRSQMVRRLSFLIYIAPMDHYLSHLPSIQEKVVEAFKTTSDALSLEIMFCLRVLFCRVSHKHLSNLWPIVISQLTSCFGATGGETKVDMFLSACKLLETLLVLGIEEFQWHQWMFITEFVDITVNNDGTCYMDKLRRIRQPDCQSSELHKLPILKQKRVKSIDELTPFIHCVSQGVYQSQIGKYSIDLQLVEQMLENEFIEVNE